MVFHDCALDYPTSNTISCLFSTCCRNPSLVQVLTRSTLHDPMFARSIALLLSLFPHYPFNADQDLMKSTEIVGEHGFVMKDLLSSIISSSSDIFRTINQVRTFAGDYPDICSAYAPPNRYQPVKFKSSESEHQRSVENFYIRF